MPTINLTADLSTDKLLEAVRQLDSSELETFVAQVLLLQAQRRVPSLSAQETDLLTRINTGLPANVQERYSELIAKRRAETLTEEEYAELLRLTDVSELKQADRIQALVELAHLRQVPLDQLMDTLGIKPAPVE